MSKVRKGMWLTVLAVLLVLSVCPLCTQALAVEYVQENVSMEISGVPCTVDFVVGGTASIWDIDNPDVPTPLDIPETLYYEGEAYTVTRIGLSMDWGSGCTNITSLTLPETITELDSNFNRFKSITEFVVPGGVKVVDTSFQGCKSLERLVFSEGVEEISSGSKVSGCEKLTEIVLPDSLKRITGTATFSGASALESIELPEGVVITENSTFADCTSLKNVTLPASVTEITSSMFSGCTSLERVTAEGAITAVGSSAFNGCGELTTVAGLENVRSVGQYAFRECKNLSGSPKLSKLTEVGSYAFYDCTNFAADLSGAQFTGVDMYAFYNCSSMTGSPDFSQLSTIGKYAFYGCYSMGGTLDLSALTSVPDYAFIYYGYYGYFNFEPVSLRLGSSMESIGEAAFMYVNFDSGALTIPGSVETIGKWAFDGTNLTDITIDAAPDDIVVADGAFPQGVTLTYTIEAITGDNTFDDSGMDIHTAAETGGTVVLAKDVVLSEPLSIRTDVTITGDYVITSDKAKSLTNLIVIEKGAALTLEGGLTLSARYVSGSAIVCQGELYVKDDVVVKNAILDSMRTAVIDVSGAEAKAVISGGSVEENKLSNDYSASVRVSGGAQLEMTGGSIRNNSVTGLVNTSSAGVLVYEGGTFAMSGGEIYSNSGVRGSGVMVYNRDEKDAPASFTMTGGSIRDNSSSGGTGTSRASGAVHVEGYARFELKENGKISGNQATGGVGGGVCVVDPDIQNGGTGCGTAFIMTGGEISGNSAQAGGGVYSYTDGVRLESGKITENTAGILGGDVYSEGNLSYYSTLYMENALITDNTATEQGGGLWFCATGETTVHEAGGAAIFGNRAVKAGDDFAFTQSEGTHKATLAGNTLGGGSVGWYEDGGIYLPAGGNFYPSVNDSVPRYGAEGADISPVTVRDSSSNLALKAVVSDTAQAYARELAELVITGNTAAYGGGVGANGGVTIGAAGETKSLHVEKIWEGDDPSFRPDSIEIVLKNGQDEVDRVQLSADADGRWTHDFTGLDENGSYTVCEEPVAGYTSQLAYSNDGNTATITNTYVPDAVEIQLVDMTVYVGGKHGYNGVVDGDDTVRAGSLPVPGFLVELPEALRDVSIEDLHLVYMYEGTSSSPKFTKYGPGEHEIYCFDPADGGTPVRMCFTNDAGEIVQDDEFDLDQYINQELKMNLYIEGGENRLTLYYGNAAFPIKAGTDATLRVRGAHDDAEYGAAVAPGGSAPAGKPGMAASQDTVFTINNSPVLVDDPAGVALLFDNIIETNEAGGTGNTALFLERAEAELGRTAGRHELKYLDLADRNNGNAWVVASEPVTVYWPLPEGTNAGTEFTLLHFMGLDRDMDAEDVAQDIHSCKVENVPITNDGEHISFTIEPGGFSPFLLLWDKSSQPGTPVTPSEPELGPNWLNTKDHYAYIIGYEDGTVRPEASITRAEVATIFFRLLTDEARDEFWCESSPYTDVAPEAWFNNAVSTLRNLGILDGYEDGTFRPNDSITRAEFAKIAVSFFAYKDLHAENIFTDVAEGSWYESFVAAAAALGLIEGYDGGVFCPDANITRAEACTILNRTIDRAPDADHLLPEAEMHTWPDNTPGTWFYADMQEATNSHDYKWSGDIEHWTEKLPERDWSALED